MTDHKLNFTPVDGDDRSVLLACSVCKSGHAMCSHLQHYINEMKSVMGGGYSNVDAIYNAMALSKKKTYGNILKEPSFRAIFKNWNTYTRDQQLAAEPCLRHAVDVFKDWQERADARRKKAAPAEFTSSQFHAPVELTGKETTTFVLSSAVLEGEILAVHTFETRTLLEQWNRDDMKISVTGGNDTIFTFQKLPGLLPETAVLLEQGSKLEEVILFVPMEVTEGPELAYYQRYQHLTNTECWPNVWRAKYSDYAQVVEETNSRHTPIKLGECILAEKMLAQLFLR